LRETDPSTDICVLDDLSTGYVENLAGLDVEFVQGSILDQALLRKCVNESDAIVHLAAIPSVPRSLENPERSHDANATGTLRVLEAARAAGNVYTVVASSSSVYGSNPQLPKSESMRPMPMSPYAVSKLTAETYAAAYSECYGLPTLSFRFFNIYGPGQAPGHAYAAVVPAFFDAALAGRPVPVFGDGRQTRDFTFVGSVCRLLTDAVARKVTGGPTNLAFGTRTSLLELISLMDEVLGAPSGIEHLPARKGDVRDSQADTKLLGQLFPGSEPTPLKAGLEATAEWFRSR
jgi:UDP-glucose 4-epimerase